MKMKKFTVAFLAATLLIGAYWMFFNEQYR